MSLLQIPNYSGVHLVVYGDVMLDRYYHGSVSRISPEAPVPVVSVHNAEARAGGAANVALNVAALGAKVALMGIIGDDEEAALLRSLLLQKAIDCQCLCLPEYSTTTKLRVLVQHQQLLRLDFEKHLEISHHEILISSYQKALSYTDAVILSDYAKGVLTKNSNLLIQQAQNKKIPVFVDPKSIDFSSYAGATVITPNLKEFQAVVGDCAMDAILIERARRLIEMYQFQAVLVTRGADGISLIEKNKEALHFPALSHEIYDVTGAGDTVIATMAASFAAGCSLPDAVQLANLAAGIAVTKLGVATVNQAELQQEYQRQNKSAILTTENLLLAIAEARSRGETIVMTNGCFDLLHVGHLEYS